jgi:hypothetical protein
MVSERKDMLPQTEARPDNTSTVEQGSTPYRKTELIEEIAENGEAILELQNGDTIEVHGHDAYFFAYEGVIFTEHEDSETWIFAEDIVTVSRH